MRGRPEAGLWGAWTARRAWGVLDGWEEGELLMLLGDWWEKTNTGVDMG